MTVPIERSFGGLTVFAVAVAAVCIFVPGAGAAPHVVGYERFHSDEATAEGGAILFSELGCAACHGASAAVVPRQGPRLIDLSQRIERDWLIGFLKDPSSAREGSTMPQMLHGVSNSEVEAVVAYLGSLGKKTKLKPGRHANAERGSALYHEKGCLACHAPTPDFRSPHGDGESLTPALAIAHPDFREKTSLEALAAFLSDTSTYRPDGRMPHFQMDAQEAFDIAAHLIDFQGSDPRELKGVAQWPDSEASLIKQGKETVTRLNCAACHELPGIASNEIVPLPESPTLAGGHCLSEDARPGLPRYELTGGQRESLKLFLSSERSKEDIDGKLTLAAMNCYACHDREGVGGPLHDTDPFFIGDESLGDSGRLPPPLTGIGHKLQADSMKLLFEGSDESRVRPYLNTQMPSYPAHAEALTQWLQAVDAKPEAEELVIRPDDIESGRKLLGIHGGTNCITCHHWGEQRSLGIPALDISSLDARIRPSWFREYLLNPASYRPGTLMPPLWPGGQSTVPDVLEGDTERQIASIWAFIKDGQGIPEGFPERSGGQFELVPEDRPIIQRTFFKETGTKAILVGFPGRIHLAFDGSSGRPSLVWRGRFFDAYDTWFTRGAPFEKPLSEEVYPFDEGGTESRFLGYQIDQSGAPTFLLERNGGKVTDSYRVEEGVLIRTLTWAEGGEPEVAHPAGAVVETARSGRTLTLTYSWK
ncbi:MAG: c-type cytochrome [Verrucomicrobiales bacterium]|nr:c-type cytochrome [Verrucomicrobiales bacterium]